MHAPGARFHFGAGAVRSCARGLSYRGTRDCPCVGRAVSIRDPIRIRRGAKPKQGRGATPSRVFGASLPQPGPGAGPRAPTTTRDAARTKVQCRVDTASRPDHIMSRTAR